MKHLLICCLFLVCVFVGKAQVVTTYPAMVVEGANVSLTFKADAGSQGLKDFTGDVYAHTGVITDKSASDSDWRYVKAGWTVNLAEMKLVRSGSNTYQLMIKPDIRTFYNVPDGEQILKLAIVFRSADGSKEGKDAGYKDVLIPVYASGVNVSFVKPTGDYSVVMPETQVAVSVSATNHQKLELYLDDQLLNSTDQSMLTYTLNVPKTGKYVLRAVASSGNVSAADICHLIVHESPIEQARPLGVRRGVNHIDGNSATFLIFAPYKQYIYLSGDFNGWMPDNSYQMKKDGDYFWLTVSGLMPDVEYAYQYWIDGKLQLADAYTNKVLDPVNDQYISDDIYPGLKAYPTGKATGIVSVFQTNEDVYNWNVNSFAVPKADTMVVYELLIRDFTAKKDIKTVTDTLMYLKRLGVNVIELMPINEFEGNDSWGYNPSFYFAPEKAYGTANDYKEFIDACHQHGIAVIQDLVLNHSFGQSPLVQMYFYEGKPAANNPWYNVASNMKHPDAQWGYDFNHERAETQQLVDSICRFWLSEYKVDGFRFDFTKGFTNTPYGVDDWASAYDASRIALLKRMAGKVREVKLDALIIFEHLAENSEEKELADSGILLWGNQNNNVNEGTMGYVESNKSDLSWGNYKSRGFSKPHVVKYMESHDEERLMAKNLLYGKSTSTYNTKNLNTALERMKLAGVVLFSIPGPVMIWQFGELGYDVSIDEGGRTSQKPLHWDYQQVAERKAIYDTWAEIIKLKKQEPAFSSADYSMNVTGAVKTIYFTYPQSDVLVVGNFDMKTQTTTVQLSAAGFWYDYFKGDSINVSNKNHTISLKAGEYRVLSQKKLSGFDKYVTPRENILTKSAFAVPNPCDGELEVYNPFEASGIVEMYDYMGEKMLEKDIVESVTLNLDDCSAGVFVVKITTSQGSATQKVVKK